MKTVKGISILTVLGIFGMVAASLNILAKLIGMTYKEVNIIVYYFLIPLSWFLLLHWTIVSILYIGLWTLLIYTKRKFFKEWCDCAFDISVIFLLKFQKIGWNYWESSVIICVIIPALIYYIILELAQCGLFPSDKYHFLYRCFTVLRGISRGRFFLAGKDWIPHPTRRICSWKQTGLWVSERLAATNKPPDSESGKCGSNPQSAQKDKCSHLGNDLEHYADDTQEDV